MFLSVACHSKGFSGGASSGVGASNSCAACINLIKLQVCCFVLLLDATILRKTKVVLALCCLGLCGGAAEKKRATHTELSDTIDHCACCQACFSLHALAEEWLLSVWCILP